METGDDSQTMNMGKGGVGRHGGSFSGNGSFSLNLCLANVVRKLWGGHCPVPSVEGHQSGIESRSWYNLVEGIDTYISGKKEEKSLVQVGWKLRKDMRCSEHDALEGQDQRGGVWDHQFSYFAWASWAEAAKATRARGSPGLPMGLKCF